MKLLRIGLGILCLTVALLGTDAKAEESATTIAVYVRHTFRGVSKAVPPDEIDLPQVGLRFTPPMFSYGMDAMPEGLRIAQKVYPRGLRAAVEMAAHAAGAGEIDSRWDLIQPDLGASRDFETALHLRRGLGGGIPLAGVPSRTGKSLDYVTQFSLSAFRPEELATLGSYVSRQDHSILRKSTGEFLCEFQKVAAGDAASRGASPAIPQGDVETSVFRESAKLATAIEMAAAKGPPLRVVFGLNTQGHDIGKLVRSGLKVIAGRWLVANPGPFGDIQGWFPIHYIDQLPPRSRQIFVGHDTQLFFIFHALGLISPAEDFADGPVLPMESAIFAFHGDKAAVVRLQLQLKRDGSAGAFESRLVWQGTRAEWDARVAALRKRLESHPATIRLLGTYRQPAPVVLKVDQE